MWAELAAEQRGKENVFMSLLKCPKCGEMFSDSYKECPFCLEDDEFYGRKHKDPGRRVERPKAPSILGPAMVVVVLLLCGYLTYAFLGGQIAQWFGDEDKPGIEDPIGGENEGKDDPQNDPQGGSDIPAVITVSDSSLALKAGESEQLSAEGAEGEAMVKYTEESGKVTAVKAGSATITATAEKATSAACVVTVTAPAKDLVLQSIYGSRGDISIRVGGTAPMEVLGTDSAIEWSTLDSSVATVDADGYVTGVGGGRTEVVAKVDGQTLTCIVRVS